MNTISHLFYKRFSFMHILLAVFIVLLINTGTAMRVSAEEAFNVEVSLDCIIISPSVPGVTYLMLRVANPRGELISEQSTDGAQVKWSLPEGAEDGSYTWEVTAGFGKRKTMRDEAQQPAPRSRPWRQSGTVSVTGGTILPPSEEETGLLEGIFSIASAALTRFTDFLVPPACADVVYSDDVIIQFSLAVGNDAINNENFGFDTIRLKENNLRIHFWDTSNSSAFPGNDWRIIINDSTNGGGNYFAVEDSTAGRVPFRIEAGAPANSLYVEDYGRIGLGTATPVVELHIVDSDTPTVRLDQDESGGWKPQVWDVAGNESNFFIRDATNGSRLPFRIQPNTPGNTLCLKSDDGGRVGIGTWSPQAKLDVRGNAFVLGNLEVGSSREYKENIQILHVQEAMGALRELRPVKFNYRASPDEESVGFIAEEVPDLIATKSRKSLSTMDIVAVLAKVAQEQQKVIEQLTGRIIDLEKQIQSGSKGDTPGNAL